MQRTKFHHLKLKQQDDINFKQLIDQSELWKRTKTKNEKTKN